MSERWPGGIISQTAPVPSGPYQNSTAPGVWTLEQQAYWAQLGQWPTVGNIDPSAFIENLFQTWLYTGTGLSVNNTITNGIDLAGKGGLVWTKARSAGYNNALNDTARGFSNYIISNSTGAQNSAGSLVTMTANSNGYTVNDTNGSWNESGTTFASWTFREQAKFFDIVTYTGDGNHFRDISHSLGSVPGMIIVKELGAANGWAVYHRTLGDGVAFQLQSSGGAASTGFFGPNSAQTSTTFQTGNSNLTYTNGSSKTYVAYLFAHNAGGFGTTGNENVISCGSYTGNGSVNGPTINLGYEPQWVLQKRVDSGSNWHIQDIMRGMPVTGNTALLLPNSATGEYTNIGLYLVPNATGFQIQTNDDAYNASGGTFIYMAIRRPMKTPTSGTEVFSPNTSSATTGTVQTTGFPIDLQVAHYRVAIYGAVWADRLRGVITTPTNATSPTLLSSDTSVESTSLTATRYWNNTSFQTPTGWSGNSVAFWNFRRAPGFFDVVCYTGNSTAGATQTHNLGVVPELIIVKARNIAEGWPVYVSSLGNTKYLQLNSNAGEATATNRWNNTSPTSSVFTLGTSSSVNFNTYNYVAYLFASVAGVSKVGSYAGTGATQTIDCGFTGGARFVLIKRSNDSGGWYVWDTARGMVAGTDPFLALNTTDPETNLNTVYTIATGFQIVGTDPELNASGNTYIFLAIA